MFRCVAVLVLVARAARRVCTNRGAEVADPLRAGGGEIAGCTAIRVTRAPRAADGIAQQRRRQSDTLHPVCHPCCLDTQHFNPINQHKCVCVWHTASSQAARTEPPKLAPTTHKQPPEIRNARLLHPTRMPRPIQAPQRVSHLSQRTLPPSRCPRQGRWLPCRPKQTPEAEPDPE
jgi:hypothetical protein